MEGRGSKNKVTVREQSARTRRTRTRACYIRAATRNVKKKLHYGPDVFRSATCRRLARVIFRLSSGEKGFSTRERERETASRPSGSQPSALVRVSELQRGSLRSFSARAP